MNGPRTLSEPSNDPADPRLADVDAASLSLFFSTAKFALSIWGFVALACLRGDAGPNKYGSDPLAE